MKAYIAFLKKEFMEMMRTNKLLILAILFAVIGIMNPAIAKLTPEIMKMAAESMEEAGLVVGEVVVNDYTSWSQFFKNIPIAMILFLVLFSGILTTEYQKGTLVPIYTRGIRPGVVLLAKDTVILLSWTAGYAVTFFITYFYNVYYWGNDVTQHYVFAAVCVYVLGLYLGSVMMLFSTVFTSNTSVLVGTAVWFGVVYLAGMIPKVNKYLPVKLMDAQSLMTGKLAPSDYTASLVIALIVAAVCLIASLLLIPKKAV